MELAYVIARILLEAGPLVRVSAVLLSEKTRPDTRLPQSRGGGQGPYLRSLHHLGRSSEAKDC